MHIGYNRQSGIQFFYFIKGPHAFFQSNAARRIDRRPVGLVKRGLENIIHSQFFGDFDHGAGHIDGVLAALNLTRAGQQRQRQLVAEFKIADFDNSLFHLCFL